MNVSQHKVSIWCHSDDFITDGMGNPVILQCPGGPDSSMVEYLVQFQKGLGLSPGLVTFHAAIITGV